jgi:DNA-directed RNA polymerase III subunit RPC1
VLASDASAGAAGGVMRRLAKWAARWIGERGFSIGVDDVTPAPALRRQKAATIAASYADCQARAALSLPVLCRARAAPPMPREYPHP